MDEENNSTKCCLMCKRVCSCHGGQDKPCLPAFISIHDFYQIQHSKKRVWKMNFVAHLSWMKPSLAINRHNPNGMSEFRLFVIHRERGAGPACLTKQLGPNKPAPKQTCSRIPYSTYFLLSCVTAMSPLAFPFFPM